MTYALLFIFVTVHITIHIQLAHTTLSKYHPFSKIYVFASISLLTTVVCASVSNGEANVRLAILVITITTAVLQLVFLIIVTDEISKILDISVFLTWQTVERRLHATGASNNLTDPLLQTEIN